MGSQARPGAEINKTIKELTLFDAWHSPQHTQWLHKQKQKASDRPSYASKNPALLFWLAPLEEAEAMETEQQRLARGEANYNIIFAAGKDAVIPEGLKALIAIDTAFGIVARAANAAGTLFSL